MLPGRIKSLLPLPIRKPLGYAWRTLEAPFYYFRGRRILRSYTNHYHLAQRAFRDAGGTAEPVIGSLREVGIRVIQPGGEDNLINLPDNYLEMVTRVSENVKPLFSRPGECSFFPGLPGVSAAKRTEDIPAIKNGEVIALRLRNPFAVDGLEDLCAPIIHELERKIYSSHLMVDKVYLYRSVVSSQARQISWLWHYDNHPHEVLKVMIYLQDVGDGSAPLEYLRDAKSQKTVCGRPLAPLFGNSRLSDKAIRGYLANGFESHRVIGPRGTMILFDNNMIHRANLAHETDRDVVIFQVRPVKFPTRPYSHPSWTGSFQHASFNADPHQVAPSTSQKRPFSP